MKTKLLELYCWYHKYVLAQMARFLEFFGVELCFKHSNKPNRVSEKIFLRNHLIAEMTSDGTDIITICNRRAIFSFSIFSATVFVMMSRCT